MKPSKTHNNLATQLLDPNKFAPDRLSYVTKGKIVLHCAGSHLFCYARAWPGCGRMMPVPAARGCPPGGCPPGGCPVSADRCRGAGSAESRTHDIDVLVYCAGTVCNSTVGGVLLAHAAPPNDGGVSCSGPEYMLCSTILMKITLLLELVREETAPEAVQQSLASLCGAVCNLSLLFANAECLEHHQTRAVLLGVIADASENTAAVAYAAAVAQEKRRSDSNGKNMSKTSTGLEVRDI